MKNFANYFNASRLDPSFVAVYAILVVGIIGLAKLVVWPGINTVLLFIVAFAIGGFASPGLSEIVRGARGSEDRSNDSESGRS